MIAAAPDDGPARNRWGILAVVLAAVLLILFDGTSMNVAIPPIQSELGASYGAAQWIMSGYALAFGLVLVPAGRLGERIGQRRLFMLGLIGFTAASIGCGLSDSPAQIVVWRGLQGLTAGMLNPAVLALIHAAFGPEERGRALSFYGATAGAAASLGPVISGLLIDVSPLGLSWRPIFLLNVPIALAALVGAHYLLPETRGRGGSLDPLGIVLLGGALLMLIWPLIQGHESGWPPWIILLFGGSALSGAAFVAWEARRARLGEPPLIDLRLFANRGFSAGVGITVCQFAAFASLQFVLSAYLQLGLGRSALVAGLSLLPFAVGTVIGSSLSQPAVRVLGRRALHVASGLLALGTSGVGVAVRLAGTGVDVVWLAPPTLVAGIGAMMLGTAAMNVVLSTITKGHAGTASGVLATAPRVGHSLGVAVVGTALFGALPEGAREAASGTLALEYTAALRGALGYCVAAAALTWLLVFLVPHESTPARAAAEPAREPAPQPDPANA